MSKHGLSKTTEYNTWDRMKSRCYNPKEENYKYYGAKGVTVCKRWRNSFRRFFIDMGKKPTPKHTLDRINNDGNYKPSNCRWATPSEQNLNRSKRTPRLACRKGHKLEGENLYTDGNRRVCKMCRNQQALDRRIKKLSASTPT